MPRYGLVQSAVSCNGDQAPWALEAFAAASATPPYLSLASAGVGVLDRSLPRTLFELGDRLGEGVDGLGVGVGAVALGGEILAEGAPGGVGQKGFLLDVALGLAEELTGANPDFGFRGTSEGLAGALGQRERGQGEGE